MKMLFLKLGVFWRRLRRGTSSQPHLDYEAQVAALASRANPFASWDQRANWMIDCAEWLRREQVSAAGARYQRVRFLLDWLDHHRDQRRLVQATLQKTLREAKGPELFSATGLPHEPAFFSELGRRVAKKILPRPPANMDLSALFIAMFPRPADADWLLGLERPVLQRIWKLAADHGIAHAYRQQIDEALTYLATVVIAVGISPDFRQRLGATLPLQATPFMALRRELEKFQVAAAHDVAALRSVRMLLAVCQAQTDKIYAHLDEYGVSLSLVYKVERMRAQLVRIGCLIDLRAASSDSDSEGAAQVQAQRLLADLIAAQHHRASVNGLVQRSFALRARKMVERNRQHGQHDRVRNRHEYRTLLTAAVIGGGVVALAVLGRLFLGESHVGQARFFEGAWMALGYAAIFLAIAAGGGVLAACQPAVTAPALAARMGALDTLVGLRGLLAETAQLLRAQSAALMGNLLGVLALLSVLALASGWARGVPLLDFEQAHAALKQLSLIGATPLFAALTGVLLFLAGLLAGFADNWFVLRRVRRSLAQNRRLTRILGVTRAERCAGWLERNLARIAGYVALAVLLGITPVVAQFFGLPFGVRHVTLAAGTLVAAACSLGWNALITPQFWLALAGVGVTGLLNIGVGFGCALMLALSARELPGRTRRLVLRALLRRMLAAPRFFLLPGRNRQDSDAAMLETMERAVQRKRRQA
ncbi:MAG TPA: preprotein translocase subunit TatB [Burkholderiaceae bacterium]|nr:preprotein translocase subunit TatB [Burkholderiaceae bacterium]